MNEFQMVVLELLEQRVAVLQQAMREERMTGHAIGLTFEIVMCIQILRGNYTKENVDWLLRRRQQKPKEAAK